MPKYYFPQERLSIMPLEPRRVAKLTVSPTKEYHTQIPDCVSVGGCAVKDNKVKLTEAQAQYWLDQGVIGEAAGEHKAGALLEKPPATSKK